MAKKHKPVEPESSEEEHGNVVPWRIVSRVAPRLQSEYESRFAMETENPSSSDEGDSLRIHRTRKPSPSPQTQNLSSSDESERESDSEYDQQEEPAKQPIAANFQKSTAKKVAPVTPAKRSAQDEENVSNKQLNKKKKPDLETPPKDTTTKNLSLDTSAKNNVATGSESSKKVRLWSDEGIVAFLQGIIDYQTKKKAYVRGNWNDFTEFIKDYLHFDINKAQMQHKLSKIKLKYDDNRAKGTHVFQKPHEQAVYDLSDKIWGQLWVWPLPQTPAAAKANGTLDKKTGKDGADKRMILTKDGEGSVDVERRWGSLPQTSAAAKANGTLDKKTGKDGADKRMILTKDGEGSVDVERRWASLPQTSAAAKANGTLDKKTGKDGADKRMILTEDGEGSVDVDERWGSNYGYGLTEEDKILIIGEEMFGEGSNNVDGDEEWKKLCREWKRLRKEDMKLTVRKVDVKRAKISLILDNWN